MILVLFYSLIFLSVTLVDAIEITDDFNDEIIDESLWQVLFANGGSIEETNGYLNTMDSGPSGGGNAMLKSKFELQGDFDVQVDFDLIKLDAYWTTANFQVDIDSNNGMGIYISYNGGRRYESTYMKNGVYNPEGYVFTNPMNINTGKLRLKREGSEITSYYWDGSNWKALMTREISDKPVYVHIRTGSSAPLTEIHWDNFYAITKDIIPPSQALITCTGWYNEEEGTVEKDNALTCTCSAADDQDTELTYFYNPSSTPSTFELGLFEVSCYAMDSAGNNGTYSPILTYTVIDLDEDDDGVLDDEDKCPNTVEEQLVYGCSCEQILELKPGEYTAENRQGCSQGIVNVFTNAVGWAKDLF